MKKSSANKVKIAYLGTPDISAKILKDMIVAGYNIAGVFCKPDKKTGRGGKIEKCSTKKVAKKYKLPIYQPESKSELTGEIKELKPELIVVFAYGMILPKEVYDYPKYKTINIHPSLLPKYRGPAPVSAPILNGDMETGVSIIQMAEKMDAGPILEVKTEKIKDTDTTETLKKRLVKLGSKMIVDLVPKWINGDIKPSKQDDSKATCTKILKKEDGHIDWSKKASDIENQVRAYTPWPGSFTYWKRNNKELNIKIIQTKVEKSKKDFNEKIGEVFADQEKNLMVQTGNGVLIIERLKLEGKKEVSSQEFLRGYPKIIGTTLK